MLLVSTFGETALLLIALHPGVETDVSSAGAVCASAFAVLAYTQQLSIIFSVWSTTEDTHVMLNCEYLRNVKEMSNKTNNTT